MGSARRLRLLLVADAVGGVWDACVTLAGALARSEAAEVLLVVAGPEPDEARRAAALAIPGLTLETLGGRLEWMEGGSDWLAEHRSAVARLGRDWGADLIHINQLGLAAFSRREGSSAVPVLLGVHSDLCSWWCWVKEGGEGVRTLPDYLRWQHDLTHAALRAADAVVCPSGFLADEVARLYALEDRPHVVHNAVVGTHSSGGEVERGAERAIVVGRAWDEAKNVRLVAEALRLTRSAWRVVVAGEASEPGRPPSSLPSAEGLTYAGYLDKAALGRELRRAAVCIAPASYDPFGLGPAEAALHGCAVVANDIPSYREVWDGWDGRAAALFFRRNDARSLAAALDRLASEPYTVAEYAARGGAWVRERYSPERMAAGYLEVYTRLVGAGGFAVPERPLAAAGS